MHRVVFPGVILLVILAGCGSEKIGSPAGGSFPMVLTHDLHVRDPFILPVVEEKKYYLYKSGGFIKGLNAHCVQAYRSSNLKEWEGPFIVFQPPAGFWADRDFWAPEVHRYGARYYLFLSLKSEKACRGTQILEADSPMGPFRIISDGPVTPRDWECLDGTLYVDPEKKPWMVFCHEWVQVHDGEICAMRLSDDLREPAGKPVLLFKASEAPWAHTRENQTDFVTDGPFLHRTGNGELLMLWSSFSRSGYAQGVARSKSGRITGPWTQDSEPLYKEDGGHGMLFKTFDNRLMLVLHAPNSGGAERARFFQVNETGSSIRIESTAASQ